MFIPIASSFPSVDPAAFFQFQMHLDERRDVLKPPDLKPSITLHITHAIDRVVQAQVCRHFYFSLVFGEVSDVHQFVVKLIAVTSLNRMWQGPRAFQTILHWFMT